MKIIKKTLNKINFVYNKLKRFFKSIYIYIFIDYKQIKCPEVSKFCIKDLWEPDNFLIQLLNKNLTYEKDFKAIRLGKFKVFSKTIELSDGYIWNEDFFSNKKYPNVPYLRIKTEIDKNNDVIIPWEFSRLQFIPTLIQAHLKTKDEELYLLTKKIVDSWITNNQFKHGVNWMCSMDVGIRAINLAIGIFYFYNKFNKKKKHFYAQVLWAHALYILEKESFQTNPIKKHNHYSNINS